MADNNTSGPVAIVKLYQPLVLLVTMSVDSCPLQSPAVIIIICRLIICSKMK